MKQFSGLLLALLVWTPAQAFDGVPVEPQIAKERIVEAINPFPRGSMLMDKDELARSLQDYGMWRELQDRGTFPSDMPKVGEPYDWVTGNVIRKD